jgi:hypothetical protein
MCGRYLNSLPVAEIAHVFGTRNALPNYPARYNIAPTQPVLTVRFNPQTKERSLDPLRWGLVPHWAKDVSFGARCINARAETVATTPAFRDAFKSRRCLIPASDFYERKKTGTTKTPYAILPEGDPLFAFAGLWENWRDKAAGERGVDQNLRHHYRRAQRTRGGHPQPHARDPAARGLGEVAGRGTGGERRTAGVAKAVLGCADEGVFDQHAGQQPGE